MKYLKKYYRALLIAFLCAVIFCNYLFFISTSRIKVDEAGLRNSKTMPPSLILITVALGPIRGLIADALWWRVAELQERSEYFEIMKITEWITTMQPNNPYVWTYHAWNLTYNIAYEFPTAETRWEWIYNGIKLLRDEGLQMNPDNNYIKNELGWIFVDRVGGTSDAQFDYYIYKWSEIMGKYMRFGDYGEILEMTKLPAELPESGGNPSLTSFVEKTNAMRKKMKLDPGHMLKIDKEYGPFNWLLPQATAVYWSARKDSAHYSQGYLNYKVVAPVAMQQSFLKGSIVSDSGSGLFVTTNNLEIAPNIIKMYRNRTGTSKKPELERAQCLMFLISAIPILYSFDKTKTASLLFDEYKKLRPEVKVDFRTFTITQLLRLQHEGAARYKQSLVEISLYSAYKTLAENQHEKAAKFADSAEKAWEKHQKIYGSGILKLPPLENIKTAAFCKALNYLNTPSEKKNLLDSAGKKESGALYIENAQNLLYNGKPLM